MILANFFVRLPRHNPPRTFRNETSLFYLWLNVVFRAVASEPSLLLVLRGKNTHARNHELHEALLDEWQFHQALIPFLSQAMETPVSVNAIII
jgi:hypothetical protein